MCLICLLILLVLVSLWCCVTGKRASEEICQPLFTSRMYLKAAAAKALQVPYNEIDGSYFFGCVK